MARKLQIKRGAKSSMPTLSQGEFGFTTDTNAEELYIGNGSKNIQIARQDDVVSALNDAKTYADEVADDLATHTTNNNNPHGVTAAQVGALPLSGGTMSGNLQIINSSPVFAMTCETTGRFHKFLGGSAGATFIYTQADTNNYNVLKLNPETSDLSEALQLVRMVGGTMNRYNVLHTGNLGDLGCSQIQTGSYTGAGAKGADAANSLTFDFTPKVVFVGQVADSITSTASMVATPFVAGATIASTIGMTTGEVGLFLTWGEKSVSWYSTKSAAAQMNQSGYTYYWVAIG